MKNVGLCLIAIVIDECKTDLYLYLQSLTKAMSQGVFCCVSVYCVCMFLFDRKKVEFRIKLKNLSYLLRNQ